MGKLSAAAAATGLTGTGAAGIYGAHQLGAFDGFKAKTVNSLAGEMKGTTASYSNKCLQEIFQDGTIESDNLPSLKTTFT